MDTKIDTAIRAEGAELFVRAVLMVQRGLIVSQASRNMPGYDLLVTNLENGRTCKVQVKYRKAKNADGMKIKSWDFDFVAYVAGGIGKVGKQVVGAPAPVPAVYILPEEHVKNRVSLYHLYKSPTRGGHENFLEAWHLIDEFLDVKRPST